MTALEVERKTPMGQLKKIAQTMMRGLLELLSLECGSVLKRLMAAMSNG